MRHLTYFKLGQHRGAPRIWFEGRRLEDIGAMPGSRFDLRVDPATRSLTIIISESGVRRVSSKPDGRPCLDINTKALAAVLGPVDRVRATFSPGRIVVTVHPDDAAAAERLERLNRRLNAGHALSVGSLFHGAGILDNALHAGLGVAGVKTALAFAVEVEDRFLQTSLRNNPIWTRDALAVAGSVDEVDLHALPKVDILTAGIPCTGASLAGRAKRGLDHAESHPTAGHLFVAFLAIVKATNPGIVLIENVPPYQHTASMEAIRGTLGVLGYDLHETILDAHDLGALEARKRLCAVAVTRGLPFSWEGLTAIRDREK
ncbi:MAG: DNA cytosine methyltransferase, partial [Alphaproteobacteria bacterium]|nr:DNA cytosine methyltransferase [Alphaproteobacteria bacterium]